MEIFGSHYSATTGNKGDDKMASQKVDVLVPNPHSCERQREVYAFESYLGTDSQVMVTG